MTTTSSTNKSNSSSSGNHMKDSSNKKEGNSSGNISLLLKRTLSFDDDSHSKESSSNDKDSKCSTTNGSDKHKRFENEGVTFKSKLIGSELVMEPRGDKMCQNSIQRLKAIIKGTNSHKRRVVLKISYDGVKVYDEKSNEILHHHEVSQISYIASDDTDNRTFGYVSDVPNKAHQFICFKTSGPAITVMSVISALFEAVLERKSKSEKENSMVKAEGQQQQETLIQQDSMNLIGDSGIIDGDLSILSEDKQQNQAAQSFLERGNVVSPGNSFSSNSINGTNSTNKQSSASTDLIFDDLFAGLNDPIIVDKNDSLISYKQAELNSNLFDTLAGVGFSSHNSNSSINNNKQQQAEQQNKLHTQQRPRAAHPIPSRKSQNQPLFLPPPSSLPRPTPMMPSGPQPNRSLVYNHSSVSLSDAALTRQSSFTSSSGAAAGATAAMPPTTKPDSYTDRYAVFNDIDNLPSIFESTSLNSVNNLALKNQGVGPRSSSTADANMFRQTNPFDDDFFA